MPWIEAATRPPGMQPRPSASHAWYEFKNLADDEAEVLVYDEIGGYWGTCAEDFVRELRNITARKITVRVNSPGGSFFDGVTCANALRAHPSNVTVRVEGLCASAASVIAMAGDRIEMAPQTQLMIHDAIGGCYGNAKDMQDMVDVLDRISDSIADAYAARSGGTREEWRERTKAETWYSPEEALAAGLIDEAIPMPRRGEEPAEPMPPAEPEMSNSWDLSVFRYAGRDKAPAPSVAAHAKPGPPPAPTTGVTLTADVASLVGEQVANALRAAVTPAPAPAEPEPVAPVVVDPAEAVAPGHAAEGEPETQRIVVQLDADTLAAAIRKATQSASVTPQPEPTAAATGLAARAAHLTKPARPAAPTWRDRVAHLNPPSSATTQPAP